MTLIGLSKLIFFYPLGCYGYILSVNSTRNNTQKIEHLILHQVKISKKGLEEFVYFMAEVEKLIKYALCINKIKNKLNLSCDFDQIKPQLFFIYVSFIFFFNFEILMRRNSYNKKCV